MSLCESIDTLAMAYLDDELAAEERHELETHLTECTACRAQLDAERSEHVMLRTALVAPPATDLLRAKIGRALDGEDRAARRQWSQYLLPGSAMLAAAAAIAMFVGVKPAGQREVGTVTRAAVSQQMRQLPLERGPETGNWLHANFQLDPQPNDNLLGTRLLPRGVNGHDGALLAYQMDLEGRRFVATVLAVRDIRDEEMQDGDEVKIGDRTLHVMQQDGQTAVSYVDSRRHIGFLYMAPDIAPNELVWLAGSGLLPPR
jgi:hypothetical protein